MFPPTATAYTAPTKASHTPLSTCSRAHHWSTFCTQLINSNFRMPLLCSGSCHARGDTAQHDTEKVAWNAEQLRHTADLTAAPLCARIPTRPRQALATHLLHQLTGFTG